MTAAILLTGSLSQQSPRSPEDHSRSCRTAFLPTFGGQQVRLVLLTLLVFPLSMVPLELQRRIVNAAVDEQDIGLILMLASEYVGFIAVNGTLK